MSITVETIAKASQKVGHKPIHVLLPLGMWKAVAERARILEISGAAIVRIAVREYLLKNRTTEGENYEKPF